MKMKMKMKMSVGILIGILLLFVAGVDVVGAQIDLPAKQDGFLYKERAVRMNSILIEAFLDPVCPDSRDAWGPLKQAVDSYGAHLVSLIVHPFPLPYHDNAFVTSRALHIVNNIKPTAAFDLLDRFFEHQEQFKNGATKNMSKASIVSKVANFATNSVGKSLLSVIESGFIDQETNLKTRISFKYGCMRGVFGTPFFFVNGYALPDPGTSALDYNGWRKLIDQLIRKNQFRSGSAGQEKKMHYF